jgi:phasin family protein
MFTIPEPFSAASKAGLDMQFEAFTTLTGKALENAEKIAGLHLSLAKTSYEDSVALTRQLLTTSDTRDFLAAGAAQIQPAAQKAMTYSRHLASIASEAQAEFTKTTGEQLAQANRHMVGLVDELAKNAPAGSENAVAMLKSAITTTGAGFEQWTKATRQAADAMEANLAAATERFTQGAGKAGGTRAK